MRHLSAIDFQNLANNSKFKEYLDLFYGNTLDIDYQVNRYQSLYKRHSATYPDKVSLFSSPGRIEMVGNHTDHNNGKVICASISLDTIACVTPTNNMTVTIESIGYPAVKVDLNSLSPSSAEYGTSEALVKGVADYYLKKGYKIGGFHATTTSNIFKGAGVSSSACFEVLVAEIFNVYFNDSAIDPQTKVFASHHAESVFFGKPCGLMDQSAIAFGNVSYIDFENPKAPIVETVNWQFDGLAITICNCGGDHCNLTPEYAAIRTDMESIAKSFKKTTLREVNRASFVRALPKLSAKFDQRTLMRAMHFFEENRRVDGTKSAILSKSFTTLKTNINESGHSSFEQLQNCYVQGSSTQPIPMALATINFLRKGNNAIRVHGGGFAGTIIAFSQTTKYVATIAGMLEAIYGEGSVHRVDIRKIGTCSLNI